MAAATQRTAGSAAFTAAIRSAVKVAIPQRLGTAEATKAMRIRPFCGDSATLVGKAMPRGSKLGGIATALVEQETCLLLAYFSIDISRFALRHAVRPPRRFATSCPEASRMLDARLERTPLAAYATIGRSGGRSGV